VRMRGFEPPRGSQGSGGCWRGVAGSGLAPGFPALRSRIQAERFPEVWATFGPRIPPSASLDSSPVPTTTRGNASEPVRVVVTLTRGELDRIEKGAPGRNVSDFLRVVGVAVADFQAKEKLSPS
jgi:hypothetical protein